MKFAVTALMIGMFLANVHDGKPKQAEVPVETFSHKYFVQLDKTNAALKVYANTPCTAPEFVAAANEFVTQSKYFDGMRQAIPLAEDEITHAHETEVFIGFATLANDVVVNQNNCLRQASEPDHKEGL